MTTVFNRLDTLDQDLQTALSDRLTDRQTLLQLAADVDKVREDRQAVQQLANQLDTLAKDRTRPLINLFWFGAGFGLALVALYLFTFIR